MTDSRFWRPLACFCNIQGGFQKPMETPLGTPTSHVMVCLVIILKDCKSPSITNMHAVLYFANQITPFQHTFHEILLKYVVTNELYFVMH